MAVEITRYDLSTLPEQDQEYLVMISGRLDEEEDPGTSDRIKFLSNYLQTAAESTQRNQELLVN